ncbi:hypothetical protein [Streptococcus sp.]|uniref:hypothetical protein n=1 Tax=Streptococcus sp. TaxID=1306 RepID=UPI00391D4BE8
MDAAALIAFMNQVAVESISSWMTGFPSWVGRTQADLTPEVRRLMTSFVLLAEDG